MRKKRVVWLKKLARKQVGSEVSTLVFDGQLNGRGTVRYKDGSFMRVYRNLKKKYKKGELRKE